MLVRLIRDCTGPNPEYSAKDHQAARARGEVYPHQPERPIPAGTEIEHPDAWRLCLPGYRNAPPKAEPLDAPARQLVEEALSRREAGLRQLQAQLKFPPKDPVARKALRDTAAAYGLDRHGNPVEPAGEDPAAADPAGETRPAG